MKTAKELYTDLLNRAAGDTRLAKVKSVAWEVVGMLDKECEDTVADPLTKELSTLIMADLRESQDEDAILFALYDVFYWQRASTIAEAVKCLKTDYSELYDEKLIKACAREMLYGRGLFLLPEKA